MNKSMGVSDSVTSHDLSPIDWQSACAGSVLDRPLGHASGDPMTRMTSSIMIATECHCGVTGVLIGSAAIGVQVLVLCT